MLKKRIIACLDVKEGKVVKGVKFRNHKVVGDILDLAKHYAATGCDELVFYDITASPKGQSVSRKWIEDIARVIDIPFCVAGGVRSLEIARELLNCGADKISINSPAIENPELISILAKEFGRQCVVVGVDSRLDNGEHVIHQYTGDVQASRKTKIPMLSWIRKVEELGAGEIVLNCMDHDGVRDGFDCEQIRLASENIRIPLVASGGAGKPVHFRDVLKHADAALAAGVFHRGEINIPDLKSYLLEQNISVREYQA